MLGVEIDRISFGDVVEEGYRLWFGENFFRGKGWVNEFEVVCWKERLCLEFFEWKALFKY